jgi:integrase
MQSKLTKRTVDAANEPGTVWDSDLPGFGLRISKGGAKTYVLKYRMHTRQRWYTLGQHGHPKAGGGVWTPQTARDEAVLLLGRVKGGVDPAGDRAADREAATLKDFQVRYMSEHAERANKASTLKEKRRILKSHIIPNLGHIKVKDLTRNDIAGLHTKLKSTPYEANRCLALISNMMAHAEAWDVRVDGGRLCRTIKKHPEAERERHLVASEACALGDALKAAGRAKTSPHALAIIRLLAFTGARRGEIEGLKWSEVDLTRNVLCLDDSKAKRKTSKKVGKKLIPLAGPAALILAEVPRIDGTPYVFPAATGQGHYQGLGKVWRAVRKDAGLEDVRLHDLRHTFASVGASSGLSLPIIGKLLGHSNPASAHRYMHFLEDPIQRAGEQIGSAVAATMDGGGPPDQAGNAVAAAMEGGGAEVVAMADAKAAH